MAKRKKIIKPLFDVKHDFYDSLDAFIEAVNLLYVAVNTAVELGQIKEPVVDRIKDSLKKLEAAMMSTEDRV